MLSLELLGERREEWLGLGGWMGEWRIGVGDFENLVPELQQVFEIFGWF